MPQLTLQLLGGFRVHDAAGREIRIASRKGRALLAYLAFRAGDSQSRDRLANLLWDDTDDELARTSLRQALAAVRKCLPEEAHPALLADVDALRLDARLIDTDIALLRRSLSSGTRTALQAALTHYRGDLLEGFDARSTTFDEWLSQERTALRREVADALHQLAALCAANDDTDGALNASLRLVALEPLNEAAHRKVMELHAHRNAYADALRQYQICRDVLRRELDVAPEPQTEALYRDLMRRRRAAVAVANGEDEIDRISPTLAAPVPAERRPGLRDAVILVARLEGLLELEASLDPEDWLTLSTEFQNRVQRTVGEFGGKTDRRVGANVLAVFGVPDAYGNEAERAIRAALALHRAVERSPWPANAALRLQIGVSQGQIVHGQELFPLTGRPTHLAHALAAAAADKGVLISDEVSHALGERVDVECVRVDSLASNSGAWQLLSMSNANLSATHPFVGRRTELAMVVAVLDRCVSSRHGRAIVVRGEAGIGKTRLADAVGTAARARGIEVHSAHVFDFGQSLDRRPIATLALSLLHVNEDASADQRAAAVARAAAAAHAGIDHIIFLSDLIAAPLTPELAALEKAMEPSTRQRGRSLALAQLIEEAARKVPQLFVIEDVHWADQDELARFGEIAAVVANSPILFIMTTRPEGDPINSLWRARARGCPVTTIDLAPLADDEAQELAAHYPELSDDVIAACISRAEGNPLFLDQLLRAATTCDDSLPGSVRSLIVARADRLSAEDHHALQASAVLGNRFSLAALRHMIGNEDYDAAGLVTAGLAQQDGDELEFVHALVRDAICESTLKSHRRELHRRAADWFVGRDLALHADHLAAADEPGAVDAYVAAARSEQADLRFERALMLATKANTRAREPLALHGTNCLLGEILLALGRTHDALTAYREAVDFAPDPPGHVQAWFGVASALRIMDRHVEALEALDRAETALDPTADAQIRARLLTLRGNLCFPLGRLDDCLRAHELALQHAQQAQSPLELARAYGGLGDAWYQRGRMMTARGFFARSIDEGRRHGLPGVLLANLPMLGITQVYCGDVRAGCDTLNDALELTRRAGDLRGELLVHLTASTTYLMRGQPQVALNLAQQSLSLARQLGARRFQAELLGIISLIHLAREERAEAANLVTQGLELGRSVGMNYCGPSLLSIFARTTTDDEQRRQALREGEELLAQGCVSHTYFEFYGNAIEVSLQQSHWSDARRYADGLAAYTHAEPLLWTELLIRRSRALADIGEGRISGRTAQSLQRLRATCISSDFRLPLAAIEAALARIGTVQV